MTHFLMQPLLVFRTPLDETIQAFGGIVDSYSMQQSVEDGITVPFIMRLV